ncbi:hypothetical protein HDU97_000950 [Phlyctochytrium planicorne]|nr:hypothetical protein HDU97_000950 [Phlyctochytrium planicorne]
MVQGKRQSSMFKKAMAAAIKVSEASQTGSLKARETGSLRDIIMPTCSEPLDVKLSYLLAAGMATLNEICLQLGSTEEEQIKELLSKMATKIGERYRLKEKDYVSLRPMEFPYSLAEYRTRDIMNGRTTVTAIKVDRGSDVWKKFKYHETNSSNLKPLEAPAKASSKKRTRTARSSKPAETKPTQESSGKTRPRIILRVPPKKPAAPSSPKEEPEWKMSLKRRPTEDDDTGRVYKKATLLKDDTHREVIPLTPSTFSSSPSPSPRDDKDKKRAFNDAEDADTDAIAVPALKKTKTEL